MGCDSDGGNTVWHIIVAALGKDSAAGGIKVLAGTLAVCKVVAVFPCMTATSVKGAGCSAGDGCYFPTGHHLVGIVIAIFRCPSCTIGITKHLVIIRQLNLLGTIVVAQRIHVGDDNIP